MYLIRLKFVPHDFVAQYREIHTSDLTVLGEKEQEIGLHIVTVVC